MNAVPRVLVVAGHDPSGAGLDADRDALDAHAHAHALAAHELAAHALAAHDARAHALDSLLVPLFVATAHTDQHDGGVRSIGARDPNAWAAEAEQHARGGIAALKFGLLPGAAHVLRAAQFVADVRRALGGELPIVLDPVIAASSGARFLDADGVEAMRGELIGRGLVVTPNLAEAAELTGIAAQDLERDLDARIEAARLLLGLGARAVLLKGGHGVEDPVRDLVLALDADPIWLTHPRTAGGALRGSGCRFAAHLAGSLALGRPLSTAARDAGEFVAARIAVRATRPRGS